MSAGRTLVPLIVVPDEGCGPAMLVLSPPQRAFVFAKVHFGCKNAEAARRAGYSKNHPEDAKVTAYRLAHSDEVQVAIIEESRKIMSSEGPRSIKTLVDIRDDQRKEAKDRIKAAIELLNRGGLNAVSEHHLTVEHQMTDAQKDQRILALCLELGLPEASARKLLIAPNAIDGEFTEVEPDKTPEELARAERYARTNEREKQHARRALTPEELAEHKQETLAERSARMKVRYADAQNGGDAPVLSSEGLEDVLAPIEE
jgi:hypothetical protein